MMRHVIGSIAAERWPMLPEVDPGFLAAATGVHSPGLAEAAVKLDASRPAADDNLAASWTGLPPPGRVRGAAAAPRDLSNGAGAGSREIPTRRLPVRVAGPSTSAYMPHETGLAAGVAGVSTKGK